MLRSSWFMVIGQLTRYPDSDKFEKMYLFEVNKVTQVYGSEFLFCKMAIFLTFLKVYNINTKLNPFWCFLHLMKLPFKQLIRKRLAEHPMGSPHEGN